MNLLAIIFFIFIALVSFFYIKKINNKFKIYLYFNYIIWILIWLTITTYNKYIIIFIITIILLFFIFIFFVSKSKANKIIKTLLFICLIVSFLISLFVMLSIFSKSISFFKKVDILEFLFSLKWDHYNNENTGYFGIIPLLVGTTIITIIAMFFAIPLGLFSAIYISEYASTKARYIINTILQILSAIPTVVYGYFSVVFLSSYIKKIASFFGLNIHSESALVAGLSIGIMILPFIISLLEDAIRSVPKNLKYGFIALGATSAETIFHIIIPYAMPTILSAILLSISRVIGETMIVLMVLGVNSNLTFDPFDSVTTITVQIATLLTGDQDFNSIQTLAAYSLSLVLFIITWFLNVFAIFIINRS